MSFGETIPQGQDIEPIGTYEGRIPDEELLETGDVASQVFERVPVALPPEPVEQIFYDNIFPPKEDLKDEGDRLSLFRSTVRGQLTTLGVSANTIDAVTLGADELITNAKRYAWGGSIEISFIQTGDVLVEVRGAEAHPPQLPEAHRETVEIEDEFSESLDLSDFGIDMGALQVELVADLDVDEAAAALRGLQGITATDSSEHGRGLNIVRAQSQDMGRYREPLIEAITETVETPAEDTAWRMWFTVSDSNHAYTATR
ncbi:MAG: hypothetical protein ACQR33_01850 [Candidatus Saccharibacteria bacterium]